MVRAGRDLIYHQPVHYVHFGNTYKAAWILAFMFTPNSDPNVAPEIKTQQSRQHFKNLLLS